MSLTSYSAQIVLQNLLQVTMGTPTWPTAWYLGVSSTLPTFAKGSGTPWNFTEPVDSAYARQAAVFAAGPTLAYAWAEQPNSQITFPTAAVNWAEVSWLGVFDAVAAGSGNLWAWFPLVRTTTDGATTAGSTTVTSATMNFNASDVGQAVIAAGILPGTTIASVTSSTAAVMTSEATATATGLALAVGTPVTIQTAEVLTLPVGGPLVTLQ
jgi:hypothetical protein